MDEILVQAGQVVQAGDTIALRQPGQSTGPHLHFEVHVGGDGQKIDPLPWLRDKGIAIWSARTRRPSDRSGRGRRRLGQTRGDDDREGGGAWARARPRPGDGLCRAAAAPRRRPRPAAGCPGRRGRRCRAAGSLALLADAGTWPPTRPASPWPSAPSPWPSARPAAGAPSAGSAWRSWPRSRTAPAGRGGRLRGRAGGPPIGSLRRSTPAHARHRHRPGREPGALAVLHQGRTTSLNVRGAYLEVLADALGSVAVVVAALVIAATGWTPPTRSPPC